MMILVCIDDTDNIDSKGTGELCETIAEKIEEKNWGICYGVTRHQLFIHDSIPYTSHNSSMCIKAEINDDYFDSIIVFASNFLEKERAEGSDPGLCVVDIDTLVNKQKLIDFGYRAKSSILTKEEAYKLANDLNIYLSEHGGTGEGIIGALAGTGLRLTGKDGRFKGKHKIKAEEGIVSVKELINHKGIDLVKDLNGKKLDDDDLVVLGEKVKTVLMDDKSVLLVYKEDDDKKMWYTCTKQQLRRF